MRFFDAVIGQDQWKKQLTTLWNESNLPHSLLLYGEEGMELVHMAMAIGSMMVGRSIFSLDGGHTYLEGVMQQRIEQGESEKVVRDEGLPLYIDGGDAFWLRPMKTQLRVDQWYTLLESYLQQASDTPRVVIIEGFQTANAVVANAMLKTIEEPPRNTYFILMTHHIDRVLPTILSRCMSIGLQPIPDTLLEQKLRQEGYTGDVQAAVRASRGNLRKARQWAQTETIPTLELAMYIVEMVTEKGPFFTNISMAAIDFSSEELQEVFSWIRVIARDMMALRYGAREALTCVAYAHRMEAILSKWSTTALQGTVPLTLEGEQALRLHIRTGLVLDGVILRLRESVKEDI